MFDRLAKFLKAPASAQEPPGLRAAVAMLLVEAARRDDEFGAEERAAIARLLRERFSLSAEECGELLEATEEAAGRMVQLYPYTDAIAGGMTPDERVRLIEMLWEVAYADGVLDPEEDLLIRKVAGLIYVTDRERVVARQRALARLNRTTG